MNKRLNNIRAWLKRNVFVASLKPRTVLAFSFVALVVAMLPIMLLWFAMVGTINATYLYEEDVTIPAIDKFGIAILAIACIVTIATALVNIVKVTIAGISKRHRLRKARITAESASQVKSEK